MKEVVEYLINQQADPNTFDRRGNEPLADAVMNGNRHVADLLVKAGSRLSHESNLNLQYRMCQLAATGYMRDFQALLAGGVAVDAQGYDCMLAFAVALDASLESVRRRDGEPTRARMGIATGDAAVIVGGWVLCEPAPRNGTVAEARCRGTTMRTATEHAAAQQAAGSSEEHAVARKAARTQRTAHITAHWRRPTQPAEY